MNALERIHPGWGVAAVRVMAGIILVVAGWVIEGSDYVPGLMLEAGAAMMLLVPLALGFRRERSSQGRVDRVDFRDSGALPGRSILVELRDAHERVHRGHEPRTQQGC